MAYPITITPTLQSHKMEMNVWMPPPYPVMRLNALQHLACAFGGAAAACTLGRPIVNLQAFYFLSETPAHMSQRTKTNLFYSAIRNTKWFGGSQPFIYETLGFTGLFFVHEVWDRNDVISARLGWPLRGFVSGALTGISVAAIRQPYDVLRATAEHPSAPRKFSGPLDVLLTSVRHKPDALKGLYKGVRTSVLANTLQFSALFGIWDMLKADGVEASNWRTFFYAFCASFVAHAMQYPVYFTRQAMFDFNARKRFGGVSVKKFLLEQRKRQGLSILYTGFFKTRPMIGSIPCAIGLVTMDLAKRTLWQRQHGG
jgi:hypothetical protein